VWGKLIGVEARRSLGPDEQHLTRRVVKDESGAGADALGFQSRLAVAREHEQVGANTCLEHLAFDPPAARQDLRRSAQSGVRRLKQRPSLLLGDSAQRGSGWRRWMAAEQAGAAV
jgi:hypothetical protein